MRKKVAWSANTRSDMQFEISQLAHITEERFHVECRGLVKRSNTIVRHAHKNLVHLKFPCLERDSLRLVGYSDAAYAKKYDLSSQIGRIILLMDDTNRVIPISFKSYKSRRVERSVLSAEVIAFSNLFDDAYTIRSQTENAIGRAIPMHLLTDSKSLFDIISKGSRTSEKRIMHEIHANRQAYQAHEISKIRFVRKADDIVDGLTKSKKQSVLLQVLVTRRHTINCEQWIFRENSTEKKH